MRTTVFRTAISCALLAMPLSVAAQQFRIEVQGNAANESRKSDALAQAISKKVGEPASGKGQVVFFRTPSSPGAAIRVAGDGQAIGTLPAGNYFAKPFVEGAHAYTIREGNQVAVNVRSGHTYYVQVTRDRAGQAKLVNSNPIGFQRATRR